MIRLMVVSLLAVGVIGAAGAAAMNRWAPAWGGSVIGFAAAVNLAGFWLASVPMAAAVGRKQEWLPRAVLLSTAVRLVVVGIGAAVGAMLDFWPRKPLAAWLVVFYVILLVVESGWAVRMVGRELKKTDGCTTT